MTQNGTQRIFGTDGVRGLANGEITAELAVDLGAAAARVLVDQAIAHLHQFGSEADLLRDLARFVLERDR